MCDCPTCLHRQKRADRAARIARDDAEMTLFALAWIAEHHGLDDTDAARHLRRHAINGTGVLQ
jgi:hypothetical protein